MSGEGCFSVGVHPSTHHKLGYQARLRFQITQQNRDQELMESIVGYLNCGIISFRKDVGFIAPENNPLAQDPLEG